MKEFKKPTKIEAAIKDTKARLLKVEEDIMLLLKEKSTLNSQIDMLETIKESEHYE